MTANLNPAKNLDLCSAFVFTDVTTLPRLHVDPLGKKASELTKPYFYFKLNINIYIISNSANYKSPNAFTDTSRYP